MTSTPKTKTVRLAHSPHARGQTTFVRGVRPRPVNHSQTAAVIPTLQPAALGDMDDLLRRAADTARKSRAESTQQSYNTALQMFAKFAVERGQTAFPADARTVAAFLQHRIDTGVMPGSLNVALSAIRYAHRAKKKPDPAADPNVRAIFHDYRRICAVQGKGSKQTRGMSKDDLGAIIAVADMNNDILATRDIAVISLLREGLLRPSECAALRVGDFSRESDGNGRLRIARSKTDQEGQGRILFLGKKAADRVARWLDAAPADANTPLFRRIRRNGCVRTCGLAKNFVSDIVRKRGESAGIFGLSGHSGRVGMAQSLIAFGASIAEVAIAGRWKSPQQVIHYASRQDAERSAVAKYHRNRV